MKPLSLGNRLTLLNSGVLAVGMLVLGVVMFAVVDFTLVRQAEGLLRDEFHEVASALLKRPLDLDALGEALQEEVDEHRYASLAFRVRDLDGRVLACSPSPVWDLPLPPPAGEDPVVDSRTVTAPGTGQRHRIIQRRIPSQSFGPVELEGALRLGAADAAREDLVSVILVLGPGLLLFALAAGNFLSRKTGGAAAPPA